jgi:hypothetical protein
MPNKVWPRTGQRVDVLLPGTGDQMLAVVDDARPPEQLHLREPVTPEGAPGMRVPVGKQLKLRWTTPAGLHELAVVLIDFPFNRVQLWKLAPLTVPVVEQRRAYLRAPDALQTSLRHGTHQWHGVVIDISEGGARCVVDEPADLVLGGRLNVVIDVEGEPIEVEADVLAIDPMDGPIETARATIRLRFHAPDREASDIVRRRVLEQERRARAMARSMERT